MAMAVPDGGPYLVSTAAIAVENTHNFGGGTVQPIEELRALRELTAEAGVAVHLDGARLWNAHVATGVPLAEYGALADTVSVCLSKGLGAPVGSVLVGSADRIAEARVWRKRYGGGMRQVGVLAAAGRTRWPTTSRGWPPTTRGRSGWRGDRGGDEQWCDPAEVETNIVVLRLPPDRRRRRSSRPRRPRPGVLVSVLGPRRRGWSPTSTSTTPASTVPARSSPVSSPAPADLPPRRGASPAGARDTVGLMGGWPA